MLFLTPTEFGLFDPGALNPVGYWMHLLIGSLGLLAALLALSSRKGLKLHRIAGYVFMACVLVAAITAISFSFTNFAPPAILSSLVALYAIAGAWLVLRPALAALKRLELGMTTIIALATLLFIVAATRAVLAGVAPLADAASVAIVPLILLAGDIHYFRNYADRTFIRLRRHLWRMSWAFTIAVRAPLFEVQDDFGIDRIFVNVIPLFLPPAIMLLLSGQLARLSPRRRKATERASPAV